MKPWYASKTIWANTVAFLASFTPALVGFEIPADMQAQLVAGIMAAVNIGLRIVTKEPIK